jgi:putative transposase
MSAVDHCADNTACAGFSAARAGTREPSQYRTRDEARADLFDYLERSS